MYQVNNILLLIFLAVASYSLVVNSVVLLIGGGLMAIMCKLVPMYVFTSEVIVIDVDALQESEEDNE